MRSIGKRGASFWTTTKGTVPPATKSTQELLIGGVEVPARRNNMGVPVGLMFHAGAPLLLQAGVSIPGLNPVGDARVAVEAYPGVRAREMIGKMSYKSDAKPRQNEARMEARRRIVVFLASDAQREAIGFGADLNGYVQCLVDDASGDRLDALLCAIQAAWGWRMRHKNFGFPPEFDALEGWIPDPWLFAPEDPQY